MKPTPTWSTVLLWILAAFLFGGVFLRAGMTRSWVQGLTERGAERLAAHCAAQRWPAESALWGGATTGQNGRMSPPNPERGIHSQGFEHVDGGTAQNGGFRGG